MNNETNLPNNEPFRPGMVSGTYNLYQVEIARLSEELKKAHETIADLTKVVERLSR